MSKHQWYLASSLVRYSRRQGMTEAALGQWASTNQWALLWADAVKHTYGGFIPTGLTLSLDKIEMNGVDVSTLIVYCAITNCPLACWM